MKEQHAYAIDVALARCRPPGVHLGSEVQRCAGEIVGRLSRVGQITAAAEVHQDDAAIRRAADVLRFHVAMQHPGVVNGLKRVADCRANAHDLGWCHPAVRAHDRLEVIPLDQLHPQSDSSFASLGAVNGDHMRMSYSREQTTFVDDVAS